MLLFQLHPARRSPCLLADFSCKQLTELPCRIAVIFRQCSFTGMRAENHCKGAAVQDFLQDFRHAGGGFELERIARTVPKTLRQ